MATTHGREHRRDAILVPATTQAYGHSWTGTHEFDQTLQVKVAPCTESIILAEQPVYRVTGDPVGIIRFREVKLPVPAEGDLPRDAGFFAAPQ
ncbi:hypothetical protein [Mycolicibacterium iranicum]|uniref:Uncharacterized protein n=1 Tax=Mycolicibacterium iranicum TaxID=912594 RepID=A0A178M2W5_MYCIR|nr:hypothetical protein [Mycolicibacterium iranicum]OAN41550.1 hypothetical protein A4X20_13185 [Mycolicibacterium iranicum]